MRFYISTTGIKKVTISSAAGGGGFMKGKNSPIAALGRRFSQRTVVLPVVLLLGLLLPFIFVRFAFVVLESATACPSSIECLKWRFFGGSDAELLREELTRALLEASNTVGDESRTRTVKHSSSSTSFGDLVKDMTANSQDFRDFAFKTKAMMLKMEQMVQSVKKRESFYWYLASHGVPKSQHCLSLKLAEEYAVNAVARSPLPSPEFVYRLTDPSFHHVILLTDNILAASAAVSSAIKSSKNPEKLVFHVVTDKKTYTSMHAWFAVNLFDSAVVEVKGLHQYDWSHEVNIAVQEMLEIHKLIWNKQYRDLAKDDSGYWNEYDHKLEVLSQSCISLLNHLRMYLPELFPDLNKVVFLDDDVVVQHDLSPLWDLDLNEKVVGAVVGSRCGRGCCPGRKYKDYFNITDPIMSSKLDYERCGWLYGMNVFDLKKWRKTNIAAVYRQWLKLSMNSGFSLWRCGALPPALLAFEGHVHPIDPSWHVAGLGHRFPLDDISELESAAVLHFSGLAKPWLEIGSPEMRSLWNKHVNFSNRYVRSCGIKR